MQLYKFMENIYTIIDGVVYIYRGGDWQVSKASVQFILDNAIPIKV